jgi:hypothetical protein
VDGDLKLHHYYRIFLFLLSSTVTSACFTTDASSSFFSSMVTSAWFVFAVVSFSSPSMSPSSPSYLAPRLGPLLRTWQSHWLVLPSHPLQLGKHPFRQFLLSGGHMIPFNKFSRNLILLILSVKLHIASKKKSKQVLNVWLILILLLQIIYNLCYFRSKVYHDVHLYNGWTYIYHV